MGKFISSAMSLTILFLMVGFGYVNSFTHSVCLEPNHRNSSVNTIYQANLRTLLDSLVTNAPLQYGFFNTSVGNGSDRVHGLAWCQANVSSSTCSKCLNDSISTPLSDCPKSKDLVMWSSLCTLRLSNGRFFGQLWNSSSSSTYGRHELDDPMVFSRGFSMMETLARNVSSQPLMFETSVIDVGKNGKRYGLAQCSRDLSKLDCKNCLENLLTTYQKFVMNRTGWEMRGVSCDMWYDNFRFYVNNSGQTPTPINNSSPTSTPRNTSGVTPNTIFISGSRERWHEGDVILAFVSFILCYWIP